MERCRFEVEVPAPFRLDLTVWTLRRRPHNAVDRWEGASYGRTVLAGGQAVEIVVRQERSRQTPLLAVELRSTGPESPGLFEPEIRRLLDRTLGLRVNLEAFYALTEHDEGLATLAEQFVGMRPPLFPTVFEAAVNAVACQQLSLVVGVHLLNRLALHFGPVIDRPDAVPGFPTPERLAEADPQLLRDLGFSWNKAHAVTTLARQVTSGSIDLESLSHVDDDQACATLIDLNGIGRWSAEYILLRGLGRWNVLPGDDVGARNNLRKRFGLASSAGYEEVAELSRTWWPYGGLVYFHLLLDALATAGHVTRSADPTRGVGPETGRHFCQAGQMRTAVHGMPRIGERRALKWALESFWKDETSAVELETVALAIRQRNWQTMATAGVDFIPSNDFSLYDHVLDAIVMVDAVPARFRPGSGPITLDRYFAMARGGDIKGRPVAPLDLTKWFDTNYHHLVPEIGPKTDFRMDASKPCRELIEATALEISTTPVLLGPLSLLLRSARPPTGVDVLSALEALVDIYAALLVELAQHGASWVRLDEPALVEDRSADELAAFCRAYQRLSEHPDRPNLAVSTYFGHVGAAMAALTELPIEGVGLDFCRGPENLHLLSEADGLGNKVLFAGVVDGRNVWANDLDASLTLLDKLTGLAAEVVVSTSCSLLHVPLKLAAESTLDQEVRPWLAFAEEKLVELAVLARGAEQGRGAVADAFGANRAVLDARRCSPRVSAAAIRQRMAAAVLDPRRSVPLEERVESQQDRLGLPLLPTTTIGSFPQTTELRRARGAWRAGRTGDSEYRRSLESEIDRVIALQESIGLDVLVHGEPERDDMVRYFASQMSGFVLPEEGWVQSYGSRCVRPPVLFGDVARPTPITLEWARYAQSRTTKPVKGMLTGPLTMLRWSFVRDDQPEADTATQLGLAIRDELANLQSTGISVIQVDEPALREGLPLRQADRPDYLTWATRAFRLVTSAADPDTQIHTHMCYAALGDIMGVLEDLDVDVVSLEAARTHMGLVDELEHLRYRGGIGPGTYDVHSPRLPEVPEVEALLRRALGVVDVDRLWVNPDCGLKTRSYEEVMVALSHMVTAAHKLRGSFGSHSAPSQTMTGPSSPEM